MHPPLIPLRLATLAALLLVSTGSCANWVLPAGALARLGGGTASMGCVSVQHGGTMALDGGALVAARDVQVAAGAQLQIGSGRVELAQQWTNNGTATATSGGVTRVASPGCPVVGQAGTVALQAPPSPQPVPLPAGGAGSISGTAQVTIGLAGPGGATTALPPACAVTQLTIDHVIPPGAPANARFPLGVLRFAASSCPAAALRVSVTYPPGSLASLPGLLMRKHGPHGAPVQTGWFTPPGLAVSGDTVSYTVTDGGDGDGDPTPGRIADPFGPMLLAAAPPGPGGAGAHAIPTLGEWGVLLLSALAALLGARHLRRTARRPTH